MTTACIVGAGVFGISAAIELAKAGIEVHLCDANEHLLAGASANNHNRLHLGYHYLRSPETARQSIAGFLAFVFRYGDCVVTGFPNYYAIASEGSKSTAHDFTAFCEALGIPFVEDYPDGLLLNRDIVESCFRVPEPLVNVDALRQRLLTESREAGVQIHLRQRVLSAAPLRDGGFRIDASKVGIPRRVDALVNASYGREDGWLSSELAEPRNQRYEQVVIPIVKLPTRPVGLTLMDGLFGSVMPDASSLERSLIYHVRHSVYHGPFHQEPTTSMRDPSFQEVERVVTSCAAYFPVLLSARLVGLKKALRVVDNDPDDSRISGLFVSSQYPGYVRIMSGKISTCIQLAEAIRLQLSSDQLFTF